jgi:hypothetical protein
MSNATLRRPTSALWTRMADAASYERNDLEFLSKCRSDLLARCRSITVWNTRPWLYKMANRFMWAELDRIDERMRDAREATNY